MINEDEFFDAVDAALDKNEQQEEERVCFIEFSVFLKLEIEAILFKYKIIEGVHRYNFCNNCI